MMFKVISKLLSKKEPPKPALSPEEQAAFDKGREYSNAQIAEIEQYMDWRCGPMKDRYLEAFQSRLDAARQQTEFSPILLAREEYSQYVEYVQSAQDKMKAEIKERFQEWTDFNRQLGVEADIERWLDHVLGEKFSDISLSGLNVMLANADILKAADESWRRKYPDVARRQPLD